MSSPTIASLPHLAAHYVCRAIGEEHGNLKLPYSLTRGANFEEEMKRALAAQFLRHSFEELFATCGSIFGQATFSECESRLQDLQIKLDRFQIMSAADNNRSARHTAVPKVDEVTEPFMTLLAASYGLYLEKGLVPLEDNADDPDQQLRLAAALLALGQILGAILRKSTELIQAKDIGTAIDIAIGLGVNCSFQMVLSWISELPPTKVPGSAS
jgi:hypothetical protein